MNHMGQSVHNSVSGARAPFTTGQWAELEHQALIFKYMMANVNVPQELLNPIRKSVATMNGLAGHHASNCKSIFIHALPHLALGAACAAQCRSCNDLYSLSAFETP